MVIGGYSKFHPFIWLMQKAENFACRKCDYYISMLANARRYLMKHGLKNEKFFFIPKGFSNDEINIVDAPLSKEHQRRINEAKTKSKLIIGYTGGHAPSNALKCFVSASKHFDDSNDIAFVLVGKGSQKHELIKMAKEKNQKNIYFLPPISRTLMPIILRQFDILYAGGVKSILHSFGTSFNKITDYLLAGKPIIFAVDEPNSIVKKIGCGIQIPAENEIEIIKAITSFAELSNEELTSMGKKGREYALQELNYTTLARKYIEIIK
jgi:glycosyltransferase involved in cell wall biosynthesis